MGVIMANDLNQCNFIGRLGRDVETRFTSSGKEVCNFSIACGNKYNGKDETIWINVVAWEKLANICAQYLKKGSRIYLSGRMSIRSYEDNGGNKRYITEIVANQMQMLDSRDENLSGNQQEQQQNLPEMNTSKNQIPNQQEKESNIEDDFEIPF
jgi:single-strand DNA-binding protein